MRVYGDDIDVALATPGPAAAVWPAVPAPASFVWNGRRYVVREVLDRWVERTPWWRLALTGAAVGHGEGVSPAMQEQVWRVEASPGRLLAGGVYDLARSQAGDWQLRRVAD